MRQNLFGFLLVLSFLELSFASSTCPTCTSTNGTWCLDTSKCNPLLPCKTEIKNSMNCPRTPTPGYEFTDDFGRNVATVLIAGGHLFDATPCFKSQMPTATFYRGVNVPCSGLGPNETCYVYTAYDTSKKAIMVSFRGTETIIQLAEEIQSFFDAKEMFFDIGYVFKYFYDAFYLVWNQGLEAAVRNLKYTYPDFDIWIIGHSLGGGMASVCASHIIKTGLYTQDHLRLVTFGQPRTGDKDYAKWVDDNFLYAYRVVHHKDMIPHIPPRYGNDTVYHHRYEIWYNNNMTVGEPWSLCQEEDGFFCSNTQVDLNIADHIIYYAKDMRAWGKHGCP